MWRDLQIWKPADSSLQHSKSKPTPVCSCLHGFVQTQMQCVVHGHDLFACFHTPAHTPGTGIWDCQHTAEHRILLMKLELMHRDLMSNERFSACIREDTLSTLINKREPRMLTKTLINLSSRGAQGCTQYPRKRAYTFQRAQLAPSLNRHSTVSGYQHFQGITERSSWSSWMSWSSTRPSVPKSGQPLVSKQTEG